MNRRFAICLGIILLMILTTSVIAAPLPEGSFGETAVYAEAVNLPGWLGGLLAILALVLPIGVFQWMRQEK